MEKNYSTNMRQKHLESALSSIQREFPNPNITLEQYPTSPHLAASVALTALEQGHFGPGCTVLDLGCGTGMLAMAAALLESDCVIAVDCDAEALLVARENARLLELDQDNIEFILAKVKPTNQIETTSCQQKSGRQGSRGTGRHGSSRSNKGRPAGKQHSAPTVADCSQEPSPLTTDGPSGLPVDPYDGLNLRSKCVDTVICNPPFGTKNNAGMDVRFLQTAVRLARRAVYSFHKTTTRAYLQRLATMEDNLQFTVVAEMQFDIDRTYKFHKDKTRDIAVDLIRIDIAATEDESSSYAGDITPDDEFT